MNEQEFKEMVDLVRMAEKAVGISDYKLTPKQEAGKVFSRSLYISRDLKAGETVAKEHLRSVRPGYSLHPKYYSEIIGKRALKDFTVGDRIKKEDFE
jgi:pseudaminic acid synthase